VPTLANPRYKPPNPRALPQALKVVAAAKDVSHPDTLILLCHKSSVAARTSFELSREGVDKLSPDGSDRMRDVALRADGRCREDSHL
jgi:hypothetical protein